jgi:hypothetical protein
LLDCNCGLQGGRWRTSCSISSTTLIVTEYRWTVNVCLSDGNVRQTICCIFANGLMIFSDMRISFRHSNSHKSILLHHYFKKLENS